MLRELFFDLMRRHGQNAVGAGHRWREIATAHSAEGRHYHNLRHLAQMAGELLPLQDLVRNRDAMLAAIFYHDFIYEPTAGDNEERSAALAEETFRGVLPEESLQQAVRLILASKSHAAAEDGDINLFTDADLSVLGQRAAQYREYAAAIRREYAVFPDAVYRPGRAAVLRRLLALPALYKTAHFAGRYEAAARANMRAELDAVDPA